MGHSGRAESGKARAYGKEVDMWSMGVMLYIILSAVPPFDDESGDMEALYGRILGGMWEFDVEEFDRISTAAKELVRSLLKVKTRERLTVEQALKHRWFSILLFSGKTSESTTTPDKPVLKRLRTGDTKESAGSSVAVL